MMYFLLILFFGSLFGISFMIGRKLIMLQNGQILNKGEVFLEGPYLEEWKQATIKNIKKHGHAGLVTIIRFYFKSSLLVKNKYQKTKNSIKELYHRKRSKIHPEKKETSNFLKMVSEYKNKIRKIKEKVKEEENL